MRFYKNGNYVVLIENDGTKIRRTDEDELIPDFAENVDVKITSACGVGCPFCYEGCTRDGKHADLFNYAFIHSLHPYTEMALNGNDMDHPELEQFLKFLREKQVLANITVHQLQFMNNHDRITRYAEEGLIHGIGISYNHYDEDFINKAIKLPNAVIHTINGIITPLDIHNLRNKNLKLLILGYKNIGRGRNFQDANKDAIKELQQYLHDILPTVIEEKWFNLVSFDNLAIEQLNVRRLLNKEQWDQFYMGDDGKYTFYIDMVQGQFARNSLSQEKYHIGDKTIDEMFNIIKQNNKENEKANKKGNL